MLRLKGHSVGLSAGQQAALRPVFVVLHRLSQQHKSTTQERGRHCWVFFNHIPRSGSVGR